jgi:hypothetical protein
MKPPVQTTRSQTFVIRLRRATRALRGQVLEVGTGAARLFDDLADAMAFIRARVDQREDSAVECDPRIKLAEKEQR